MATARRQGNLIVLQQPRRAGGGLRRKARSSGRLRRAGRRVGKVARSGAVPAAVLAASAALGYAQAKGWLNKIPTIGGSRAATLAVAGYAVTRFTRNTHLRMLGHSAMIVGAFDFGSKHGGGKSGLEGDDDSWVAEDSDEYDV